MSTPLLEAVDLKRHYPISRGLFRAPALVRAVDGVSFTLEQGRTLAVVGESGCGKSTLARMLTLIEPPTGGSLAIDGNPAMVPPPPALRRAVQMVFQDPYGSLNPRKTVAAMLGEPLAINTGLSAPERRERVHEMLARVGLRPEHAQRYPHMFSGGQRQRIAIARALMLEPKVVVADEPVSALDVSVRAQVLNLLADLQAQLGVAYVFISHDLSVVRHIAERVLVMYLGRVAEQGATATVFEAPAHPYTRALMAATPQIDPARRAARQPLKGEPPSPLAPPPGCPFHPRCPWAIDRCRVEVPPLRPVSGRYVACHRAEEVVAAKPGAGAQPLA